MLALDGYRVRETLHTGRRSLVYRAERSEDGLEVVLKTTSTARPSAREIDRIEAEHALGERAVHARVVRALALERVGHRPVLVMRYYEGGDLGRRRDPALPLADVLALAEGLAEGLVALHDAGLVHRDINPTNLVWNGGTQTTVIDLGLATPLTRERARRRLEGTLRYLSPEQTGRLRRSVDHRTDLYATGCTLFELLSGRPPFLSDDPLELVHCHIARRPPRLGELVDGIPEVVENLVDRLLAKAPEERYQSARGLRRDIEQLRERLARNDELGAFELGRYDHPERIEIPERVYGREAEIDTLSRAYELASQGGSQLLQIRGPAGVGKSALANELRDIVANRGGFFVGGKYDELRQHVPVAAFSQAFRSLVRQLLAEPEAVVETWRKRISKMLGRDAAVLVDQLPEAAGLLGPKGPPRELPPAESKARLYRALTALVATVAREGAPLVIFGDDLQWVDPGSLTFVGHMIAEVRTPHVLIVAAFRDDEVPPDHRFALAIASIGRGGVPVHTIDLEPLDPGSVAEMLEDTLRVTAESAATLAGVLHRRTGGNPLFVRRLLHKLHTEGVLRLESGVGWTWEQAALDAAPVTADVAALLVESLEAIADQSRQLLRLASCLGSEFELGTLALLAGVKPAFCARGLLDCVQLGLLTVGPGYSRCLLGRGEDEGAGVRCRFAHDRVQEAAYALTSEAERPALRLQIARLLLDQLDEKQREAQVFELAGHLNAAGPHLAQAGLELRAVAINLAAARRARLAAAYDDALRYADLAAELLPETAWRTERAARRAVAHEQLQNAALARSGADRVEALADELLARADSPLDRGRAALVLVTFRSGQAQSLASIALGKRELAGLGVDLDVEHPLEAARRSWQDLLRSLPEGDLVAALESAPETDDERVQVATDLVLALGHSLSSIHPEQLTLALVETIALGVEVGRTPMLGAAVAGIGLELWRFGTEPVEVARLAAAGVRLAERASCRVGAARYLYLSYTGWLELPYPALIVQLRHAFSEARSESDLVLAGAAAWQLAAFCLGAGGPLEQVREVIAPYMRFVERRVPIYAHVAPRVAALLDNLTDPSAERVACGALAYRPGDELNPYEQQLCLYLSSFCRLLSDDSQGALADAQSWCDLPMLPGIEKIQSRFFRGLATADCLGEAGPDKPSELRSLLDADVACLVEWSGQVVVENLGAQAGLLRAEQARHNGAIDAAERAYEAAIDIAHRAGNLWLQGMALERAARFYRERDIQHVAKSYLADARYCFVRWGARARVAQMEATYGPLLEVAVEDLSGGSTMSLTATSVTSGSTAQDGASLDVESVLRAARAMSSEVRLGALVRRLIRIIMESAGAGRGLLLQERAGQWRAVAEARDGEEPILHPEGLGSESGLWPRSIVRFVARVGEDVVLYEVGDDRTFGEGAYIQEHAPRSVLCSPLAVAGRVVGVVYLENGLAPGVFTEERCELVRLLAGHAAIALRNAHLYEQLDQRNAEIDRLREQLELENEYLRAEVRSANRFDYIVGESAAIQNILSQVELVGPTDATVLVTGESGTGKELLANALHDASARRDRPLITVNCATVPRELFESEFFGHVKGAFTGALRDRVGRFELADGGTLFLDEVGEIPLELQAKLLRVLQEGTFERVGEAKTRQVDVRIVAATNRDLAGESREGRFRLDLFYRLNVFPLDLPPLRQRGGDVVLLARHMLSGAAERFGVPAPKLTGRHVAQLEAYDWPGNVRELQNVCERSVITAQMRGLVFDLPAGAAQSMPARSQESAGFSDVPEEAVGGRSEAVLTFDDLKALERRNVERALVQTGGKISGSGGAAELLGVKPTTLRSRLKAMGIEKR